MGKTYKNAGVDIEAGENIVKNIKPLVRATFNEKVLTDIGLFGGFYDGKFADMEHPVLVASTDGVGTKLIIAFLTGINNTVGECLVNHCTNDILCCGAKPLFFLDYFATGSLKRGVTEQVIEGFARGCKNNGCALIGGEIAEMPSIYKDNEYDVSGTIVGVVEKKLIVDDKRISKGDIMIGLTSSGLHTNGYSLARAALLDDYSVDTFFEETGKTLGEMLLAVHKSYLKIVHPLVLDGLLNGISHITGGGIVGNTSRVVPDGLSMKIDWNSWEIPFIFDLIQKTGEISAEEMRRVFNLGIGMVLIIKPENVNEVMAKCSSENPIIIGEIT